MVYHLKSLEGLNRRKSSLEIHLNAKQTIKPFCKCGVKLRKPEDWFLCNQPTAKCLFYAHSLFYH